MIRRRRERPTKHRFVIGLLGYSGPLNPKHESDTAIARKWFEGQRIELLSQTVGASSKANNARLPHRGMASGGRVLYGRRRVRAHMMFVGTMVCSIVLLLSVISVLVVPFASQAQTARNLPRIGVIGEGPTTDPYVAAFRQGLRQLGYTEGETLLVEYRYLEGVLDRVPDLAAELLRLKIDVLVVGGTISARSARAQTTTVPIVFTLVGDPVGSGLVANVARPGGNATGLSNVVTELAGKQLQILKAAVPQIARVAVLYNPANPAARSAVSQAREAARTLAVELEVLKVRRRHELATALSPPMARRVDAILGISDPLVGGAGLAQLVAQHPLPAITAPKLFVERGGLMAYGPSYSHNWLRAATYVDKILKGASPADLPVEQPTKFELVINLKAAKALGVTLQQSVLLQADEIIQ